MRLDDIRHPVQFQGIPMGHKSPIALVKHHTERVIPDPYHSWGNRGPETVLDFPETEQPYEHPAWKSWAAIPQLRAKVPQVELKVATC